MKVNDIILIFGLGLLSVFLIESNHVYAEPYIVPHWFQKSVMYWSQTGKISMHDFEKAYQYMVSNDIIKVDKTHDITGESGNFVLRIVADKEYEFHNFSTIQQCGLSCGKDPEIQVHGIPSLNKQEYYEFVSRYLNNVNKPEQFELYIDILAKNGLLIETLDYSKCDITSYTINSNTDSQIYRFGTSEGIELREETIFNCAGYHLLVPQENQ